MVMAQGLAQNVWRENLIHHFIKINKPQMDLGQPVKNVELSMLQNGIQKIGKGNQIVKRFVGSQIKKNMQKKNL